MSKCFDDLLLRYDETLLDDGEAGFESLPDDPELRRELLRQRLAHGLLRGMHGPTDSRTPCSVGELT